MVIHLPLNEPIHLIRQNIAPLANYSRFHKLLNLTPLIRTLSLNVKIQLLAENKSTLTVLSSSLNSSATCLRKLKPLVKQVELLLINFLNLLMTYSCNSHSPMSIFLKTIPVTCLRQVLSAIKLISGSITNWLYHGISEGLNKVMQLPKALAYILEKMTSVWGTTEL